MDRRLRHALHQNLRGGLSALALLALVTAVAGADSLVRCSKPGELLVTDPAGDIGAQGMPGHDMTSLSIVEPSSPGANLVTFVIGVSELDPANPTLSSSWYVVFDTPDGQRRFVTAQTCDPTQIPSFGYGTVDPVTNAFLGDGDTTGLLQTNTICIDITAAEIPTLTPGAFLGNLLADARLFIGGACSGVVSQIDVTNTTNATLCGADVCEPVPTNEATWGSIKDSYRSE